MMAAAKAQVLEMVEGAQVVDAALEKVLGMVEGAKAMEAALGEAEAMVEVVEKKGQRQQVVFQRVYARGARDLEVGS
jgi:hypothetical protein